MRPVLFIIIEIDVLIVHTLYHPKSRPVLFRPKSYSVWMVTIQSFESLSRFARCLWLCTSQNPRRKKGFSWENQKDQLRICFKNWRNSCRQRWTISQCKYANRGYWGRFWFLKKNNCNSKAVVPSARGLKWLLSFCLRFSFLIQSKRRIQNCTRFSTFSYLGKFRWNWKLCRYWWIILNYWTLHQKIIRWMS